MMSGGSLNTLSTGRDSAPVNLVSQTSRRPHGYGNEASGDGDAMSGEYGISSNMKISECRGCVELKKEGFTGWMGKGTQPSTKKQFKTISPLINK